MIRCRGRRQSYHLMYIVSQYCSYSSLGILSGARFPPSTARGRRGMSKNPCSMAMSFGNLEIGFELNPLGFGMWGLGFRDQGFGSGFRDCTHALTLNISGALALNSIFSFLAGDGQEDGGPRKGRGKRHTRVSEARTELRERNRVLERENAWLLNQLLSRKYRMERLEEKLRKAKKRERSMYKARALVEVVSKSCCKLIMASGVGPFVPTAEFFCSAHLQVSFKLLLSPKPKPIP